MIFWRKTKNEETYSVVPCLFSCWCYLCLDILVLDILVKGNRKGLGYAMDYSEVFEGKELSVPNESEHCINVKTHVEEH